LNALCDIGIAPWSVKLPGREERIQEPLAESVKDLIEAVIDNLQALELPYAFYGHSFGAGLALEVAHGLAERGLRLPTRLVLSGRMPPHTGYSPLLGAMSDDQLWQHICAQSPLPLPHDATCSFARATLTKLKADLALNAQLAYSLMQPLPVPLFVINGREDPLIDTDRLHEWRAYTSADFQSQCVPGGHFFFDTDFSLFYSILSTFLTEQGR